MRRILSFLTVYAALALIFQLGGATPEWGPSSPLEAFCAGLFGMLALLTLVLARRAAGWHAAFWLASCVALVTLGVDELFELHESSNGFLAADHLKVALWIGAAGALAVIHWLEKPSRGAQLAMVVGYAMHTLYLVAEVGDGGYFRFPVVSGAFLQAAEGLFELAMLSAYLFAFGAIASESSAMQIDAGSDPDAESHRRAA